MTARGEPKGRNMVSRARRIASEMIMTLTTKRRRRRRRREDDERWKEKIMMRMIATTIRNTKWKTSKLISNYTKRQPLVRGRMRMVGKHATRVIERRRRSSPVALVVTNSARSEEAWHDIIPHEMMATDILPRLPVKSLARFCCVCKQWCSLTYDPRFAMQQLIRGASADPASTGLYMHPGDFNFGLGQGKPLMYNLSGLNGNGIGGNHKMIEDVSFEFKFRFSGMYMLSNSVNGLICALCQDGSVACVFYPHLVNMTTREVLELPEFSYRVDGGNKSVSLGFDSSSGRYVVVVVMLSAFFSHTTGSTFHVLTVGSRDWRCLVEINCWVPLRAAVILDGALHWLAYNKETHLPAIMAFDIKDERFRFVPVTIAPEISDLSLLSLKKLKGQLFLVRQPVASGSGRKADRRYFLTMWKLEEGANPEWRRMYDLDVTGCVDDGLTGEKAQLIGEVCGEILISRGLRLYSYDEGSKALSLITGCLPLGCFQHFDLFTPSLVSPSRLPALLPGGMPRFP